MIVKDARPLFSPPALSVPGVSVISQSVAAKSPRAICLLLGCSHSEPWLKVSHHLRHPWLSGRPGRSVQPPWPRIVRHSSSSANLLQDHARSRGSYATGREGVPTVLPSSPSLSVHVLAGGWRERPRLEREKDKTRISRSSVVRALSGCLAPAQERSVVP